jgi:hypothetical protein
MQVKGMSTKVVSMRMKAVNTIERAEASTTEMRMAITARKVKSQGRNMAWTRTTTRLDTAPG